MGKKRKGISCRRTRIKGHTKTICRSARTGKIVRSPKGRSSGGSKRRASKRSSKRSGYKGRLVCPSRHKGRKVHLAKGGGCYIKLKSGKARFVKKVRPSRARMRMV